MWYTGLCAIAKDEEPFIHEWLAYHHALGFEHFVLYDNESAVPLERTLAPQVAAGLVTVHRVAGKSRQLPSYEHCLATHGGTFRWLAFLDLDEFLVLREPQDIRLFLGRREALPGVAAHWRVFGSAGHLGRPKGLVIENYCQRFPDSEVENLHIKSIVNPRLVERVRDAHQIILKEGRCCVDERGEPVASALAPFSAQTIWINHYHYKSQQDYEEKMAKGRSDVHDLSHSRSLEAFRAQSLRPTVPDESATRLARLVRTALRTGRPLRLLDLDQPSLAGQELFRIVERFHGLLEAGRLELAELLLILVRGRFGALPEFLRAEALLHLARRDFVRAREAVNRLIPLCPSPEAYHLQFLVRLGAGDREGATATGRYLVQAMSMFKVPQPQLLEQLRQQDRLHGLGIWEG